MKNRESIELELCAVCAWRADCQKKFTLSGKNMRCPDFTKDVSLSKAKEADSQTLQSPDTP